MLFWTRAALCIGAVTVLAIEHRPSVPPSPMPVALPPWQSRAVLAACRARPETCAAALARGWRALVPLEPPGGERHDAPARGSATPGPVANGRRSLT